MNAATLRMNLVQLVDHGDLTSCPGGAMVSRPADGQPSGSIPAAIRRACPGSRTVVVAARPEVPGGVHGVHDSRRPTTTVRGPGRASAFRVRVPGGPASGTSSRGIGRPSSVAMNPSVPAGP